jgi:hypothetical protein
MPKGHFDVERPLEPDAQARSPRRPTSGGLMVPKRRMRSIWSSMRLDRQRHRSGRHREPGLPRVSEHLIIVYESVVKRHTVYKSDPPLLEVLDPEQYSIAGPCGRELSALVARERPE